MKSKLEIHGEDISCNYAQKILFFNFIHLSQLLPGGMMLTFCAQRSSSDEMDSRTVSGGNSAVLARDCWRCGCMKLSDFIVCLNILT